MKKIIRLTESDLTRIVRRVLQEANDDESQNHRYRQGADPGIEDFFSNPMDENLADELQHQLEEDKFAGGPELLRGTNIGKGTRNMFIFFNGVKMTPAQFIDQVQEDASEGFCHTIENYEYDNRVLRSTKITIKTNIGKCKKEEPKPGPTPQPKPQPKPKKACKHSTKQVIVDNVKSFQKYCISKGLYYAEYTDGTTSKCSTVDGVIGCCTATCYDKIHRRGTVG
jgi:hypothetical protein